MPDVHDVVPHETSPSVSAVGVKLYDPKFRPLIVTDPLPERIVFCGDGALKASAA